MKLWLQNRIVNESESGFVESWPTGTGIFETLLTCEGQVYEFNRHMRRALLSSQQLGFKIPSEGFVRDAVTQVLDSEPLPLGRMRIHFASDFFAITHAPYSPPVTAATLISKGMARVEGAHKKYPYTERLKILREANELKADDFILWNTESNQVTESAISNVLLLLDGQWCTSPLNTGILPGVVRALAIEYCEVKVRDISKSEITLATSGLLTSSLKVAQVIHSVDGRELRDQQAAFDKAAQIRENYQRTSVG